MLQFPYGGYRYKKLVFTVVNLYESGVIDAPAAIAELKAYKTYNQLSFHTPRVIQALRFIESYEVNE